MIFTAFIFITILLFHYHGNHEHDESYVDAVHDHYGNTDYHDNHHNHLNDKVTEENDDEDDGNRDDEMSRSRGILYPLEVKDKDIWQRISDVSNYAISCSPSVVDCHVHVTERGFIDLTARMNIL